MKQSSSKRHKVLTVSLACSLIEGQKDDALVCENTNDYSTDQFGLSSAKWFIFGFVAPSSQIDINKKKT